MAKLRTLGFVAGALTIGPFSVVQAQTTELSPVTVIGSGSSCPVNAYCSPGSSYNPGSSGSGSSFSIPEAEAYQVAALASLTSDIRCFSSYQNITSLEQPDVREALAQQLFRVSYAAGNRVKAGGTVMVIWDDLGTTSYRVFNPAPIGSPGLAIPAVSEQPGDGVPEPGVICGRG